MPQGTGQKRWKMSWWMWYYSLIDDVVAAYVFFLTPSPNDGGDGMGGVDWHNRNLFCPSKLPTLVSTLRAPIFGFTASDVWVDRKYARKSAFIFSWRFIAASRSSQSLSLCKRDISVIKIINHNTKQSTLSDFHTSLSSYGLVYIHTVYEWLSNEYW